MSIADVLTRIDEMEKSFTKQITDVSNKFDTMKNRMDGLEARIVTVEETAKSLVKLKEKFEKEITKTRNVGVMAEYKSKELNVVFSNIPQENSNEDMNESLEKLVNMNQ